MTETHANPPTSGGIPITDIQIDRLTTEAEHGYDTDTPADRIRPGLRQALCGRCGCILGAAPALTQ